MNDIIHYSTTGNIRASNMYAPFVSGAGLIDLIKDYTNPVGLEIGTAEGTTALHILEKNGDVFLHCIDPYSNYYDWNGNNLNDREAVYQQFILDVKKYESRYTLHRQTSDDAVNSFEDEQLDFIFIDGIHTYEQVLKDCENYYLKLKTGGLFSGHDFTVIEGVNRAVKEFAEKVGKEIMTTNNDVWYWYK